MQWAERKYVNIGGVNVHYIQAGEGPTVLLLHGLGTSLITWHQNVDPLVAAGFRVLALDLPGHGDSDKPREISYDPISAARLLHHFLLSQEVERVSVVGSSAGGLIVSLFALSYPEQVDRLILVASGGLGKEVSWVLRLISVPGLGELVYQPRLQRMLDLDKRLFYQIPPILEEIKLELHRVRSLPGVRHAGIQSIRSSVNFLGLRKHRYLLPQLQQFPSPLMTVWGAEDQVLPAAHALTVQERLPHSVVRILPRCGHWPHMEKSEEFNDLLIQFLRGHLDAVPQL
ncbi:MAG: alpha/beta fold hydrolase [Dehalococcoidia bacterium]